MKKFSCPGHTGKCKFCGREEGYPRVVPGLGSYEVDRVSGKVKVDPCCRACANNKAYAEKRFGVYESAKFGYRVPKGDEV